MASWFETTLARLLTMRREAEKASGVRSARASVPREARTMMPAYCREPMIENSPLRMRPGRPSTNLATASSP